MYNIYIFGCCAGNHVIMTNESAITEENHVKSMTKLTTLSKSVPGALTGIGTGKPHPYRLHVQCAAAS
jgi:hypothetical protein